MTSDSPASSNLPERIGPYQILKRVGIGGMGTVYKARHVDLGREVALKVLPDNVVDKKEMLERFRQEAKNAAKLRHEHIVTLYEIGEADGVRYLAMEYVKGKNLHQYIEEKGRLDPEEARKLMIQAARALALAHQEGIIHRDIKPSNFLLTAKDGRLFVKLADFGLARSIDENDFKVTRAGTTVGTVDYISPEQARNSRAADIRSDIYSLGCTFYHTLAGRVPFPEGDMTERLLKHVEATPEDVRSYNPNVPLGMVVVLDKMLAKRPDDRYQTPKELLADLEHLPSGPILSPRELLEALALDSATKNKNPNRAGVHGKGSPSESTRLLGQEKVVPGDVTKLRYRHGKVFNRKSNDHENAGRGSSMPIVIQGWKAWTTITCLVAVAAGIGVFFSMNWGETADPRRTDPSGAAPPSAIKEESYAKGLQKSTQTDSPPNSDDKAVSSLPPSKRTPDDTPARPKDIVDSNIRVRFERPKSWQPSIYQPPPEQLAMLEKQFQSVPNLPTMPPRGREGTSISAPTNPHSPESNPAQNPAQTKTQPKTQPPTESAAKPAGPIFIVSRYPFGNNGRHFDSLTDACAAARGNQQTIIEVHDNGPLFAAPVSIPEGSVIVRAGKGYRPLLVWDILSTNVSRPSRFLAMAGGRLVLENLDVVLKVSDSTQDERLSLLGTAGGEIRAENCTFSIAGRHRAGTSIVQLDPSPGTAPPATCKLINCYIRGADVTAFDLRAAGAEVTMDRCLVVSTNRPLVEVVGKAGAANTTIRAVHSTLVAGQSLCRVQPASPMDRDPAVHWLLWDCLLGHCGDPGNGILLDLQEGAGIKGMQWRAINCLYSGWATLLKRDGESISQLDVWRGLWSNGEGDRVAVETWPAVVPPDPSETLAAAFRVVGTHAGFADSSGGNTLGCDVSVLPPIRDNWLAVTFERTTAPVVDLPVADQAPTIAEATDGLYHGEALDLNGMNLGDYLRDVQLKKKLATKVVLHLRGKGEVRTSPILIKGASLVLYFEPPDKDGERLILVPGRIVVEREALIEVEGGGCELLGGKIRFPNTRNLPVPGYVVKVHGGHLSIVGCQLQGPTSDVPASYGGLILFTGSGETTADQAYDCAVSDSVLLSGLSCVHAVGAGARLRVQNSVLVSATEAIHLEPAIGATTRGNAPCILERNTVVARRGVLRLIGSGQLPGAADPLVVQAKANVFVDVFAGAQRRSGVLVVTGDSLAHGLAVWQGDGNVYDKQFQYYVMPAGQEAPVPAQPYAKWAQLWGANGDRRPLFLDPPWRQLDLSALQLERLALPESFRNRIRGQLPGADLEQLGLLKKSKKKP